MSSTSFDQQPKSQSESQSQSQSQDAPTSPSQSSPDLEADEWHASSSQPRPAAPQQKRRRVTRACDECRRKKIKCDGKQPCTHCTVYSYDCTYDQPSNRRRNPAPQYIEALENRLQRAESLLRTLLPNLDLNDPNFDAMIQQHQRQTPTFKDAPSTPATTTSSTSHSTPHNEPSQQDSQLRSMIESTGKLELDERGYWDFHGGSSGIVFMSRMREQFGNLLGPGPVLPKPSRPDVPSMFGSPRSSAESPFDAGLPNTMDLPKREAAKLLSEDSLQCACCLLRFVHQPTYYEMLDRIYDMPPENYGDEENRFLPLLYMTLALGCMFQSDAANYGSTEPKLRNYQSFMDQGFKYYRAARNMMDVTDCRDITALQVVLFMILFLQASANLSTCYSYIGIALRSALRMGLHRNLKGNFNPIELETRKRVFWIIRKMDTYVSAMLGFPMMLSADDIDQELPMEIDDEYLTKDAILPMPEGHMSMYVASNAHSRLMTILATVIKDIYPIKGLESVAGNSKASYTVSHAKIRTIERELHEWQDKLPLFLRPGGDGSPELLRIQQLLRLAYAHVQMMLFRPFLHYASGKTCAGKNVDERSYAAAASCITVCRNIIHITSEMKRRGLLVGAYWFTMYTTFFSIISLVYYVLENPDLPAGTEILADASDGQEALRGLAQRSMAADRCSTTLRSLFEKIPANLKNRTSPSASKKRRAPSVQAPTSILNHSSQNSIRPQSSHANQPPRATTFPMMPNSLQTSGLPMQNRMDGQFQINTSSNPNLRQNYQELMSPNDLSTANTPESTTSSSLPQSQQFDMQNQFDTNNSIPYLSAMMFPSTDPFAYPNQPMMEFETQKQVSQGNISSASRGPPMYMSNTAGIYDDLEGQLYGPLPPYLMQGQQNYNLSSQPVGATMMSSFHPQEVVYQPGLSQNSDMSGIFSNDEDWNNMGMDNRYRQQQ